MAEVKHLTQVERGYRDDVVGRLQALLSRAKSGEILSLVYVVERPLAEFTYGCTGCDDRFTQIGMVSRMLHELHLHMDEGSSASSFAIEEDGLGVEDK